MLSEYPVLRLGLAGFTPDEQERLNQLLEQAGMGGVVWQLDRFDDADAVWLSGAQSTLLADGCMRINSPVSNELPVYVHLKEVSRPVAFSNPQPRDVDMVHRFDIDSEASMNEVLDSFEVLLGPITAQFRLASQLLEHDTALSFGTYHVKAHDALLAVVDLQGDTGVLRTAGAGDFEDAIWSRQPNAGSGIPEHFLRTSLARLMWQYALRTSRDVLPKRYRSGPIYFRRLPRLPQQQLQENHLLLLRELASEPASFENLRHRTGCEATRLAHDLAALYLVGAVTSNQKRAAPTGPPQGRREASDTAPTLPLAATARPRSIS